MSELNILVTGLPLRVKNYPKSVTQQKKPFPTGAETVLHTFTITGA